jgi:hypothetical protein
MEIAMMRGRAMTDQNTMVTAMFDDAASIERAYDAAIKLGYDRADVNLMLSDETRDRLFSGTRVSPAVADKADKSVAHGSSSKAADELGGPAGGTAGTIAPAAAAIGAALLIPNLVLAGPVAVALAAAGAVGVAGGLMGALTHWGIPKHRVAPYEKHIREGGVLMGIKARSTEDAQRIAKAWRDCGGRLLEA